MALIAIVVLLLATPQDLRGEIELAGGRAIAVSPSGDLWIGTRDGRAYVSHDWNRSWEEVDLGARHGDANGLGGDEIEHIAFFDAEHAILAGSMGDGSENEILRTADGGRTWTRVSLGLDLWVYGIQVLPDGHGWLAGSYGVLVCGDFGATWRYVAGEPFEGKARCGPIAFCTPERGVVGTLGNALNETSDGGRTWTWLATPVDALAGEDRETEDGQLRGVWFLGERLIVFQCGRLFALTGKDSWQRIDLGGKAVAAAALASDRLVVVTDDQRISLLSSALDVSSASPAPLEATPFALAAGPRGIAFLTDVRGRVCTLEDGALACSNLRPREGVRSWPITAFDRAMDGTLFGVTYSALHRSRAGGGTWERLAEAPSLRDVSVSADGSHALLVSDGEILSWQDPDGAIRPLQLRAAPLHDFVVQARARGLWVATAFEATEDEETQRMLYTTDITLVGPGFTALVFSSADEGLTWQLVDEYPRAIVHAAWLGDGGVLRWWLSDRAVRSARLDTRTGMVLDGVSELVPARHGPTGQWAHWIAFPDASTGWAGARSYFNGASLWRTQDGGRSWASVAPAPEDCSESFRLGSGACVRVAGLWDPGSRVELWREGEFRELRRFEAGVHDARVDAGGGLLVRLEAGDVWRLAPDAIEWTGLGSIAIPPR